MSLNHKALIKSLRKAYAAEKAAALAYVGHAKSIRDHTHKALIHQIETDEWNHRREVLKIMQEYDIPVSLFYEVKYYIIGKVIAASCFIIGWFMPYFFAGKLESGNVCEYFVMIHYFHSLGIRKHDKILYEMGVKEKEHEDYFLAQIKSSRLLPLFEKLFKWGKKHTYNDLDIEHLKPVEESDEYCKYYPHGEA